MQGDLIFKKCVDMEDGFVLLKDYIWLGNAKDYYVDGRYGKNNGCSRFVNKDGYVVVVPDDSFEESRVIKPIKDVLCVYNGGYADLSKS